jgi:hypothetical protein
MEGSPASGNAYSHIFVTKFFLKWYLLQSYNFSYRASASAHSFIFVTKFLATQLNEEIKLQSGLHCIVSILDKEISLWSAHIILVPR